MKQVTKRIRIYPHAGGTPSARLLGGAIEDAKVIRRSNSRFRRTSNHLVVNWGANEVPHDVDLNQPSCVRVASNKLMAFEVLEDAGVTIPKYTNSKLTAQSWLDSGKIVLARTLTRAHSGRGIVVLEPEDEPAIPDAPLYTQYVPKDDEYRVHVMNGKAFFVQRKARRTDCDDPNWRIRTHANGFIYANQGVEVPDDVVDQAVDAVNALDLDFGAVDVVWNNRRDKAYVLEVNTAPGLSGLTIDKYAEVLKDAAR